MPFTPRPFTPPSWARNPHAQTLGARVLRSDEKPALTRERWELRDGDFLDVDLGPDPGPGAPLALVLHGLEGSSRRRYVLSAGRELLARGVRPVALNFRGCSGELNRRPRFYHSGETGDPAFVLEKLRRAFPGRRVGALGFSLGGNVLLKLLGEREDGGLGLVDAAAAMSVPFDLGAGSTFLEQTVMGRLYTRYFLRSLKAKVQGKRPALDGRIDVTTTFRARTLREFDDVATAKLHGFRDAEDYYASCSSAGFVRGIRTPTLVLHSLDDPFLPAASVPRAALEENPAVTPVLTGRGGHVGFLEGSLRAPRFWGEVEAARYLAEALTSG
jgi:predicted alpha/beta-fold hydrolase